MMRTALISLNKTSTRVRIGCVSGAYRVPSRVPEASSITRQSEAIIRHIVRQLRLILRVRSTEYGV